MNLSIFSESKYFAVKVFESFSIRTNWKKFASVSHSSPDDISCLDGLRSISTVWVVLTHEFLLYSQTYFINKTEHVKVCHQSTQLHKLSSVKVNNKYLYQLIICFYRHTTTIFITWCGTA